MAGTGEPTIQSLMALVYEQGQMIQDLMQQQAESEDASSYQIRDLQRQIIGLKKQRTDDAEHHEEQIQDLKKQLDGKDALIETLPIQALQLKKDVRISATNAAMEVLAQFNQGADKMLSLRLNKLEEKSGQTQKDAEGVKRDVLAQQDEVDVQLESLGSRLCQLKEDISNINSDAIAKAVAESDLKGRSVTKMRGRLDELEGQVKAVMKASASTTKGIKRLQGEVDRCKTTFYYFNEATKTHIERKQ